MTMHYRKPVYHKKVGPPSVSQQVLVNAATAKVLAAQLGGPNPLEARLVLREPDAERKTAVWYVLYNGAFTTTRCAEHQREEAEVFLADFRAKLLMGTAVDDPIIGPEVLTFGMILTEHVESVRKQARTKPQKRSAKSVRNQCTTLNRFFNELRPADYTLDTSLDFKNWYLDEREAWYADHPDIAEKDSERSAIKLLARLRVACEEFSGRHPVWLPKIEVTKMGRRKPRRWLRKSEAMALLLVCMGCRRDETGEWISRQFTDPKGRVWAVPQRVAPKKEVANHRVLARLIRFSILTATRSEAALSMTWGGPRPKIASIQCDETGKGIVHRRGTDEVETNKSRPPSPIRKKLRCLLRIWGKQDGVFRQDPKKPRKKFKYLFRQRNDEHYRSHVHNPFKRVAKLAGLGPEVTCHTLKHTAVNWALQAGYSMPAIAKMLGTSVGTLLQYYTDWGTALDETALAEFDDCARHQAWRALPQYEPESDDKVRTYDKPVIESDDVEAEADA